MSRTQQYTAALNQLDQLYAAGKITRNQYDIHRARLLAEANHEPSAFAKAIRILVLTGFAIIALMVVLLFGTWVASMIP